MHKPTEAAPGLSVRVVQLEDRMQVFRGLGELLARAKNKADRVHGGDGVWVGSQGMLVRSHRIIQVSEQLGEAPCSFLVSKGASLVAGGAIYSAPFDSGESYVPIWHQTLSFMARMDREGAH